MEGIGRLITGMISAILDGIVNIIVDLIKWLADTAIGLVSVLTGFDFATILPDVDLTPIGNIWAAIDIWYPLNDAYALVVMYFTIYSVLVFLRWTLKAIPSVW